MYGQEAETKEVVGGFDVKNTSIFGEAEADVAGW